MFLIFAQHRRINIAVSGKICPLFSQRDFFHSLLMLMKHTGGCREDNKFHCPAIFFSNFNSDVYYNDNNQY